MLNKLPVFFQNKTNLILVFVLVMLLAGGLFAANKFLKGSAPQLPIEEVDLPFDPEGPYALLIPRRDGNALILNIFRVSSYEGISYELSYQADGTSAGEEFGEGPIDRGVQGTLDTKNKNSEYSQEILFGTCSKGDTFSTLHCVFDKNVENGNLTLKIKQAIKSGDKVQKEFKMSTMWHLQKPDVALGVLTSSDAHFTYKTTVSRQDLNTVGYSIINDLTGAPKLPDGKKVTGKVYALSVPTAKDLPSGDVILELAENPSADAKIYYYQEKDNKWTELDTKVTGSKLSAKALGDGIFTVLVNSQ